MSFATAYQLEWSNACFDTTNKFAEEEIRVISNTHPVSLDVKYEGCNQCKQDKYAH
jgi:hypothetical protein